MQELSSVVDKLAQSSAKIEESYKAQTAALENMAKIFASMDLKTVATNMEQLKTAMKGSKESGDQTSSTFKDMAKQMLGAGDSASELTKHLMKTEKQVTVLGAAWSGLKQGFSNLMALGKGAIGFFKTLGSAVVNIGASIAAIPFKIFKGLVDMAAKNANAMNELAQEIEHVRKDFGDLKGPGAGAILATEKSLKGFSDTGLSAWRVFGNLAERLKTIHELAVAMGPTFSVLEKEFRDNGGAILAFQKGLGISNEEMKGISERAIAMGKPLSKVLLDTAKQTLELGKAFDIDQKLIGKDMSKAMQDVKHFGQMTVKEIGQASVYARKLGVELDKIVGTLDAFETFDTAAENSAKLSQSFGVTVDAFKMMEAQSPAEQIEMLRKQFKEAGVDSSTFNRQQLKLLSSTTGLDDKTAKLVFSQKNQGVGLDQIKKKSESAEKKQLTQAEAMGKLADSIERVVKAGQLVGSFFKMFIKGITAGLQMTAPFMKIMFNIQQGLQGVYNVGFKLGQELPGMIEPLGDFLKALGSFFKPEKFIKLFSGISGAIKHFIKDPNANFESLMDEIHKTFLNFFDSETPDGKKALDKIKTMFEKIAKVFGQGIEWAGKHIAEGMEKIAGFIENPSEFLKAQSAAGGAGGWLAKALQPVWEGLKKAWPPLWKAAKHLFTVIAHKIWAFLKSDEFMAIIKPALPIMAGILFGPMFARTIVTAIGNKLLGSLLKSGGEMIFKKVGTKFAEKGASQLLTKVGGVAGPAMIVGASLAIGSGVQKYTKNITSTLDTSSKTIAAGATGLIDALTMGLLPEGLDEQIANTLGKVVDMIYDAMGNIFGKGFAENAKRRMASMFEMFGNIFKLIKDLMGGKQEDIDDDMAELGMSILRFLANTLEFIAIQLPGMIARLAVRIIAGLAQLINKIMMGAMSIIGGGLDKLTNGKTNLKKTFDDMAKSTSNDIQQLGDTVVDANQKLTDKISDSSKGVTEEWLRTDADKARIKAELINQREQLERGGAGKTPADAVNAKAKQQDASLGDISSSIREVKDINEQLDEKGFDIKAAIANIKTKLGDVKFEDIISKDQSTSLINTQQLLDTFAKDLDKVKEQISSIVSAVGDMIKASNDINKALSEVKPINVAGKLKPIAQGLGLGSKGEYKIESKPVNIHLDFQITINAADLEQAVVLRQNSVIRQRLDKLAEINGAGPKLSATDNYSPSHGNPPALTRGTQ